MENHVEIYAENHVENNMENREVNDGFLNDN